MATLHVFAKPKNWAWVNPPRRSPDNSAAYQLFNWRFKFEYGFTGDITSMSRLIPSPWKIGIQSPKRKEPWSRFLALGYPFRCALGYRLPLVHVRIVQGRWQVYPVDAVHIAGLTLGEWKHGRGNISQQGCLGWGKSLRPVLEDSNGPISANYIKPNHFWGKSESETVFPAVGQNCPHCFRAYVRG